MLRIQYYFVSSVHFFLPAFACGRSRAFMPLHPTICEKALLQTDAAFITGVKRHEIPRSVRSQLNRSGLSCCYVLRIDKSQTNLHLWKNA
jgi:hypothetical protein